ncbi:hypothetical protein [Lignipirellula cremea]|uniref:Leucine Rich repeats (2 copies) n=1 Tax=Lignipirellula cremea TaxID=2528010 RepID=A0A518E0A8_9BACT|nr:hypothetical protein [Lignipirellula cremea]QDU97524.1 Leucine Rich repeats (2 copies) [Lignipirellula cremea]
MAFRHTLASLGLMTGLLIAGTGCGRSEQDLARRARDAKVAAEVHRLGGEVTQVDPEDVADTGLYAGAVAGVSFQCCDLWDSSLAEIVQADTITYVDFRQCSFGDHHARQLASLPRLTTVRLSDTDITDEGVRLLSQLPALEYLDLDRCQISDAAAASLASARNLRHVGLRATYVTPAGIAALAPQLSVAGSQWSTVPSEAVRLAMVRISRMGLFIEDNLSEVRDDGEPLTFDVEWGGQWNQDARVMEHFQTLSQAGLLRIQVDMSSFPAVPDGQLDSIAELVFYVKSYIDPATSPPAADAVASLSQLGSVEKLTIEASGDLGPLLRELLKLKGLRQVSLSHQAIDPDLWRLLTAERELQQIDFLECTFENIAAFQAIQNDSARIQFKSCPAEQTTELLRVAPQATVGELDEDELY